MGKRLALIGLLLAMALGTGVVPTLSAEPVPFSEAVPIVDADGDKVYCTLDIRLNDEGTSIVGLQGTDCPTDASATAEDGEAVVSIEDFTAHLKSAERRINDLVDREANWSNKKSVRKYINRIIEWAEAEQAWLDDHVLDPCVEGQQKQLAVEVSEVQTVMRKLLEAANAKNVAKVGRLESEVGDAFSSMALTLGFLIGFTDGLECPWIETVE